MALKTGISTLALGTLLLGSTAALADDTHGWVQTSDTGWSAQVSVGDGQWHQDSGAAVQVRVRAGNGNPGTVPQPPPRQNGRYELQATQRWVEGFYEQVWVPEQCRYKGNRNVTKCKGGYYQQQWVPGRYEAVQEWVWVPAPRWNRHGAAPASYYYP